MEKRSVEDESTPTVSKKLKADSSQMLKTLHEHLHMFLEEVELKEDQLRVLSFKLLEIQKQIESAEIEAGEKKKELDLLRNQIKSEEKTLIELRTSVKNTQNEHELRPRSSVIVKHEQQRVAAETELSTGDDLILSEFSSPSLDRHEVSRYLRAISSPAKFVLDLVEGQLRDAHRRQTLVLQDSVSKNLVLILEELVGVGKSVEYQLQVRAKQVATLWKGKIVIEAPRSSLEALAFLFFIVAYGLKSLINEEETVLLATSVFHYKQGPKIFHSLGLKLEIPEFVRGLIEDHHYIPAVRIICLVKLKEFSATTLLMKEITELRRSSMERVAEKDVGRLRAIVELVADYKLDIDLPGDLVAKLMFQREDSTPPVLHCAVEAAEETCTSSSDPKATSSQVAATRSGVDLLVPKRETKPFVNPLASGMF